MSDEPNPTTTPEWEELIDDAGEVAAEYRERGWEVLVLEPIDVTPVERGDRSGLDVTIAESAYGRLEDIVADEAVAFGDAEVYYRPSEGGDRRFALIVERDERSETAVVVPVAYAFPEARDVFERALRESDLQVHVRPADAAEWIVFSHGDPSLFLEERDRRAWDVD
ncbi:DUF7529 family protein [Natronococcus jeotgali]|uniref:Uncharacterized protein n=1 Tax=Natronococcus jeotgali DSM 18795 TaxID=1227498 RepID=L9XRL1_9EURY|nr:hypothetical protein [Natronococcus jeotgali]ELY64172.1 hypothetical protein C492_06612 [Natronococcus jeotgali DSM 18795]